MSEQPSLLPLENEKTMKPIEIDVRKLKMKDYKAIDRADKANGNGFEVMETLITIIGRISNYTEDELWDLELDKYNKVQQAFFETMDNIVKKANAGNSTSS